MTDKITTIRSNLETLLKTIRNSGGGAYRNDIGDVSLEFVYGEGTTYPALFVINPVAEFSDLCGNNAEVTEPLFIYGMVKDESTPQAALISLRNDIVQCLAADPQLGGSCLGLVIRKAVNADDIFKESGYAPGFKPPHACIRIECEVLYRIYKPTGG